MRRHALVGREGELTRLRRLLAKHRLVTVTGPGGVGKTSLVLAAIQHPFDTSGSTRVVVCELADVDAPDAVRHAVGASLQVVVRVGVPLGELLPGNEGTVLLVVLDNCEHVLEAASQVAQELLAAGDRVWVVATSREPLNVAEERVFPLGPLLVPLSSDDVEAANAPAVVLFAQRAQQVDETFVLDQRTLPPVVRICRALDGIPLALEIAAARCSVLGVSGIADRLGQRFALLRARTKGTPGRHRNLRAVVDWSYGLLAPAERAMLTRLAVFAGGCDLDAAMVTGAAAGLSGGDVIDVLDSLAGKSLITLTDTASGCRYGQLETLRLYGLERLDEAGLLSQARNMHADHYAAVARNLRASMLRAWSDAGRPLFHEFDNFRSALTWTLVEDDGPDRSFDLLAQMWYLALQHRAEEVAEWAEQALHRWPDTSHPLWSEVAATAATAFATLEDYDRARVWAEQSVAATRSSPAGVAFGWCALAEVSCHADDDPVSALVQLDSADAAATQAGFEPLRCDLMGRRAQVLTHAGRAEEALVIAEQARVMAREQANVFETAWSQHLLGLLLTKDQPAAAKEWLTAALADSRALNYFYGINSSARGLGGVYAVLGDRPQSAALFAEALTGFIRSGHLGERWNTVAALLPLLVAAGRRESAAALLVGIEEAGAVIYRIHAPLLDEVRAQLAEELDSPRVIARGRALSANQVLALAQQELRALSHPSPASEPTPQTAAEHAADAVHELTRVGKLWQVTYAGSSVHLPDLRGIHDLAVLLAEPDRDFLALDLATPTEVSHRAAVAQRMSEDIADGFGVQGDLGERIDAQARAAYTTRIRELQAELDAADATGDDERAARIQQELDFLLNELSAAYGMRGPRRAGDPAEKARSAVTARIRAAIAKIRDVHPELGRHLKNSIHTGRFCSYRPDEATRWRVTA
jgi:predicted ATPase